MKDNEKTIGKKFGKAKEPEDKSDVLAELETAYYLSSRDTTVEYEPKPSLEHGRSVDFLVTIKQDVQFTIEVKRIRKTEPERQLAELIEYLVSNLEAIPSSLGFGFRMTPHGDVPAFVQSALGKKQEIIVRVSAVIAVCERELQDGERHEWRDPNFSDLEFSFVKIAGKASITPTARLHAEWAVPYKQNEWKTLSDAIREKVTQFSSNVVNVLLNKLDSDTHSIDDLHNAINELNGRIEARADKWFKWKGVKDASDFVDKVRNIGAIVIRSNRIPSGKQDRENLVWTNQHARCQVTSEVADYLRNMDSPCMSESCSCTLPARRAGAGPIGTFSMFDWPLYPYESKVPPGELIGNFGTWEPGSIVERKRNVQGHEHVEERYVPTDSERATMSGLYGTFVDLRWHQMQGDLIRAGADPANFRQLTASAVVAFLERSLKKDTLGHAGRAQIAAA